MKRLTDNGRLVNIVDVTTPTKEEKNPSKDNAGYSYFPDSGEFVIHCRVDNLYINLGQYDGFQKSDETTPADVDEAKEYLDGLFEYV